MPRDFGIDDEDLVKAAQEALERPSDFGYYGDLPLFQSWGMTYAQTRDSDVLNRSNYRRLLEDAKGTATAEDGDNAEDDSEYVQEVHASHWAYGWADHIAVRVLEDPEGDISPDNITHTFRFMADACLRLRDEYPVYDESDYSELETEECEAAFYSAWSEVGWDEVVPNGTPDDDVKWCVYRKLTENETPDWFDAEEIATEYVSAMQYQAYKEYHKRLSSDGEQLELFGHIQQVGFSDGCQTCGNQWQH
jgi:hypothetical protein